MSIAHTEFSRNLVIARLPDSKAIGIQASSTNSLYGAGGNRLPDSVLEEFRQSVIPDELTLANIQWVEGDTAIATMTEAAIAKLGGHSQQYQTKPVQQILDRYEFARDGGWVAFGQDIDGNAGTVAYFKPKNPRPKRDDVVDFSVGSRHISRNGFGDRTAPKQAKPKFIKYETPQKLPGLPLLALVPDSIADFTWARFEVSPNAELNYWQNVRELGLPITITEGFKKALSLIAQGIPAIAIRGIAMWHKAGGRELHNAIAAFATPGRTVYVCFDQDEKTKTRLDVMGQGWALGEAIEKAGAKVAYLNWDRREGKGIDDALYSQEDNAAQWLDGIVQHAINLKTYSRMRLGVRALAIIDRRNQSKHQIIRVTDGENTPGGFLPELPTIQPGTINVIDAGVGSGKTTRIGADWLDKSRFTLVISPTNSVGEQTANDWGLPHIHRYRVQDSAILWAEARSLGGAVMCLDSLHRLPGWVGEIPLTIVLDEANQVIDGGTSAGTLGDRQSAILKLFASLSEHAIQTGAIVLSEDEVPDRTINFIRSLSLATDVRVIKHQRKQQPWDTTLYGGPQSSGFRARLIDAVGRERLLFVTSSQREGKRLERVIAKTQAGKKVVRIDSETNEGANLVIKVGDRRISIFDDPDTWISEVQPDILILSPSAKSGLSITATENLMDQMPPYFKSVWAYFPALGGDTHWQMLGRYRLPVPRHIYVPPFIQSNSDEALMSARRARQRYLSDAKGLSAVLELSEALEANSDEQERYTRIQHAVLDYRAEQAEVQGAMKTIAYEYLRQRLERAGHNVTEEIAGVDKPTADLWKQVQDEIWQDEAAEFAALDLDNTHTEDWAHRTLNSNDSSRVNRLRARKVLYRMEFPGVAFDDASECYEALMLNYGAMRRGVRLQAKSQNLDAAQAIDREKASKLLEKDIKALHRLPKDYVRAYLLSQLGILDLLDGGEYHNQDPRAIAIKESALKWSSEIYYRLRLQIKPDQTPVEICNKLLRKFGLEINKPDRPGAIQVSQPGRRKERGDRHYRVNLDYSPVRKRLLEACQRKLSESVHTICIDPNPNIQIVCTGQNSPQESPPHKVLRPGLGVGTIAPTPENVTEFEEMKAIALQYPDDNDEIIAFLTQFVETEAIA